LKHVAGIFAMFFLALTAVSPALAAPAYHGAPARAAAVRAGAMNRPGGFNARGGLDNRGFAQNRGFVGNRGFGYRGGVVGHGFGAGPHSYAFRGHDVRHFDHADLARWRGGHWRHTSWGGRYGWWWYAGGAWYFYDQPAYPYPQAVGTVTYEEPMAAGQPAPVVVQPPPTFRYYCANPAGYYPQVPTCNGPFQRVSGG
jgi:hypothetical protein